MTVGRIKHPQETARKEDILEAVSVAHTRVLTGHAQAQHVSDINREKGTTCSFS